MAGVGEEPVASEPMDLVAPTAATAPAGTLPGSTPRDPAPPASDPAATADGPEREVSADQVSLARRLRQPRTILSIAGPLILLVLIFRVVLNVDFQELLGAIAQADKGLLLAAFVIYYVGFPLRGVRWAILIKGGTRYRLSTRDATEMVFLSWLVNCLVPAKLGDIYRAYLLKINSPVSLSRTFGTVFIERVLDLFAISILGLAAGFWSFRAGLPPEMQFVAALGVAVIVLLALALLMLRNFGRRILSALPLPERVLELYDRFEEGVFNAIGPRAVPGLLVLTLFIWATEAMRLYFVVAALGFEDVSLGISGAFFVALIGSLLTAVPLSPAGLGIVELGVVGVLVTAYNVPLQEATTIALVDRAISVFSVIVLGSVDYLVTPLRRGGGLRHPLPQDEPSPA